MGPVKGGGMRMGPVKMEAHFDICNNLRHKRTILLSRINRRLEIPSRYLKVSYVLVDVCSAANGGAIRGRRVKAGMRTDGAAWRVGALGGAAALSH